MREFEVENFKIEILEECNESELKEKEVAWIQKLDTFYSGYNNTYGGDLPCHTLEHHLTDHGRAILTIGEVEMCRIAYKEGKSSRDMHNKYFKDKISYDGFQQMWHGYNWKEVMPEVFENNPRPARRATVEHIRDIRQRKANGQSIRSISKDYQGTLGYGTVYEIATYKRFKDIE